MKSSIRIIISGPPGTHEYEAGCLLDLQAVNGIVQAAVDKPDTEWRYVQHTVHALVDKALIDWVKVALPGRVASAKGFENILAETLANWNRQP